jgi:hypothetical protein
MAGRPLARLELNAAEEEALRGLAGRRTTAQAMALRARIVLACGAGEPNQVVAARLGITPRRWANGAGASSRFGLTACMTKRARECHA